MFKFKENIMLQKVVAFLLALAAIFLYTISHRESFATVDVQKVLRESTQYKYIQQDIEKDILDKENIVEKKQKAIDDIVKDYQKRRSNLSEKSMKDLADTILRKRYDLQKLSMSFAQSIDKEREREDKKMHDKILSATKSVAIKRKINIVIPAGISLYSYKILDVTKDVIAKLEEMN